MRKHAKRGFLNGGGVKAGVENGAMLTTYLFRYTSECTISNSNFQNFLRLRRQGATDPLNQNPADALENVACYSSLTICFLLYFRMFLTISKHLCGNIFDNVLLGQLSVLHSCCVCIKLQSSVFSRLLVLFHDKLSYV